LIHDAKLLPQRTSSDTRFTDVFTTIAEFTAIKQAAPTDEAA